MKWIYFLMGILIATFPFLNFDFHCFRGISTHFFHYYQRVAPFPFTLPPLFQKFICFRLSDFLIAALLIALLFSKKEGLKSLFFNSHSRYLTLFTCVAFLSILFSPFSRYYLQYTTLLNLTLAFLAFHLVYLLYKNATDLIPPILCAFVGVAALECLIGIGQFLVQHDLGLQFLSEPVIAPHMDNIATFTLSNGEFFNGLLPWIDRGHSVILRAHGTFDHPNVFGGYLLISLFLSYYIFMTGKKPWIRPLLLVFIPIQIFTLILTFSRGSVFAWLIGTLLFFAVGLMRKTDLPSLTKKNFSRLGLLIGIATTVAFLLLHKLFSR